MSTATPQEVLLGCDPQVRVVIIEDAGNLVIQVFAQSPDVSDIDALFFNLNDDSIAPDVTIFPAVDVQEITGFDVAPGTLNQMNNGAQLQDAYDVRIEFGDIPSTSLGDIDQAAFTLFLDGEMPLTAADIDLDNMTAVINSDAGTGLALTVSGADEPEYQVVAISEDLQGVTSAADSALIASDDGWDYGSGGFVSTNASNEGALTLETIETDGPVTFRFDARVVDPGRFEATGAAADSFRVEVSIDGGNFVLLDAFTVDDSGNFLIGSETGNIMTTLTTSPSYSGGILDTAEDSVQFRLVSDFTANDEEVLIDNFEVTVTEGTAPVQEVVRVAQTEDFDGLNDPDDSANVASDGRWDVRHDTLFTNGSNDGQITFEEVAVGGPVEISLDARGINIDRFENSGQYSDNLRLEVQVDGGAWTLLDEFEVNDAGTALVGAQTGQEIGNSFDGLSYSGGVLDGASESVQFRMISDISANDEKIRIDNLEIRTTEEVVATDETCEDFEAAQAGDVVSDQFAGVTISAQRAGDAANSENDAMIFDTDAPTGGDHDLAYDDRGNAIIISEDNDSDDPDDNAHGGTISFAFDDPSEVQSLTVLDTDEAGGTIDLFDIDGQSIGSFGIPATGDNGAVDVTMNVAGVALMEVNLVGSGAVDDLCYVPPTQEACAQYDVTYDDLMANNDVPHDHVPEDPIDDQMDLVMG